MSAFSNGTEWEMWSANWCDRCEVDEPAREREEFDKGCPLILQIMTGETPAEFFAQPAGSGDRYHCINFRGPDDGPDEPTHPEDPIPGQGELVPRSDFERPKVFVDIANEIRRVDA
jgi:hypothetical protein